METPGPTQSPCFILRAFLATALFLPALPGSAAPASQPPVQLDLPILTTAHQIHSLPAAEARRSYPVHLHGVVTCFNHDIDARHDSMFFHDRTGTVYVQVPKESFSATHPTDAGSIVDIRGITEPGDFAAIVINPVIRIVGHSKVPIPAKRVGLTRLLTGLEDAQWVEIEGIVQSVYQSGKNITLELALADGMVDAITVMQPGADYTQLIDSKVLLRGNAAVLFNKDRQLTGFRLMFPGLDAITVEQPAPSNLFLLPLRPGDSLSRFTQASALPYAVHVRGRVTLQWPGTDVCIDDDGQGICAQSPQSTSLNLGELVDVVGFTALGGYKPSLVHARFNPLGGRQLVAATPITAHQAFHGAYDARLVQIDGQLISHNLSAKDLTLMLASQGIVFPVVLPAGPTASSISNIEIGSELRVEGICSVELDAQQTARGYGAAVVNSFRILLRSPGDVLVLRTPSWWTSAHAWLVSGIAAAIVAAVLVWVIVLRKRVYQHTRLVRESEERFRHLAQHDALTGLPSRTLLHDRLQGALERARRFRTSVALLMLDLDNFKQVNDSLGHAAGDQALCVTARRIASIIRKTDTVARMGGDEFVVLLSDLTDVAQAEIVAEKLVAALSVPILIGTHEVPLSASVGVHSISNGATDAAALMKSVDAAMYYAKARGRNCFQVFTSDMERAALDKLELHIGLGRALELGELQLHYQAIVDVETGVLTGFEALLRWHSKQFGMVMPSEFIPIAEQSGLIVPIGDWVLREACREMHALEQLLGRDFVLSVNLSPRQLLDNSLPRYVANALAETGRPPNCLLLEITENILMSDSPAARGTLTRIRNSGVQLALDDFGSGFSSLSYITRFAIDWIKIDRSLLCNCTTDRSSLAVFRAIIAMAHGIDIRVIAEGVETPDQFALLRSEGCDTAQGYFLSQPVPASALPAFIAAFEAPGNCLPGLKPLRKSHHPAATRLKVV